MPGWPFWDSAPELWDQLYMAGTFWPGLAKVDVSGGQKLDVKEAPGAHGASITFKGYSPKKVGITIQIWTEAQWEEIQELLPLIEPSPNKKGAEPVDIVTAATTARGVFSIAVEDIKGPEFREKGILEFQISAVQYFPPPKKNATSTPKKSVTEPALTLPEVEITGTPPSSTDSNP